jgi:hypothetical protein
VLVDIGDSQSLQQSLSTFSGHVRRLRRVLGAAGLGSLVLLDEVGKGVWGGGGGDRGAGGKKGDSQDKGWYAPGARGRTNLQEGARAGTGHAPSPEHGLKVVFTAGVAFWCLFS